MKEYKKKGQMQGAVGAIVALVVGVSIATLLIILTGAMGGQAFTLVQDDIDAITDATINASVHSSIQEGFGAQEDTASYIPLIVLALVISIVLALVLGFANMGGGRGSAL